MVVLGVFPTLVSLLALKLIGVDSLIQHLLIENTFVTKCNLVGATIALAIGIIVVDCATSRG